MRYNLACALATYTRDTEASLDLLEPYFERVSVLDLKHSDVDPDLDPLRDHPRFKKMVAAANARPSADKTPAPA